MYAKWSIILFIVSAFMFFLIQLLTQMRLLLLRSGAMDGDTTYSYFHSNLIWIPLLLLVASLIFAHFYFKDKWRK